MYHYNAFISYNHNPRDIRIARMLQRQLENYKIPKGVSTSTGLTGIERIFLDTGELEVAGDLNKVICDVLDDTDYLIVLCSPESKHSVWVQREVEYFLREHSIDNVLTVITDGEPFDVLPDILLYENIQTGDVEIRDTEIADTETGDIDGGDEEIGDAEGGDVQAIDAEADGAEISDTEIGDIDGGDEEIGDEEIGDAEGGDVQVIDAEADGAEISDTETGDIDAGTEEGERRIYREPLSCDYRLPERIARSTELPRLVAAMVGCRYDDLVQRKRQYRMRRLTAALTAAAVLMMSAISYLVWSNNQIRASLDKSLIEQSMTLSLQSEQALRSGDRISALRYALDALPSEGNDRPVVSEAVQALSKAMNFYVSSPQEWESAVRRYDSYGNRHLRLLAFSKNDRNFLSELYNNGRMALWDADTGREVMGDYTAGLREEGSGIQNMAYTHDGDVIIITRDTVRVIDPVAETELKKFDIGGEYFKIYDANVLQTKCDDLALRGNELWIPVAKVTDHEDYDDYTVRTNSKFLEAGAASFGRDYDDISDIITYFRRIGESEINFRIVKMDLNNGEILAETPAPRRPTSLSLSQNGDFVACCYSDYYDLNTGDGQKTDDQVVVMDADDLSTIGTIERAFVSDFGFDYLDRLVLCGYDRKPYSNDTSLFDKIRYSDSGSTVTVSMAVDRNVELQCFDVPSCSELWHREYRINTTNVPRLWMTGEKALVSNSIMCSAGNTVLITDADGNEAGDLHPASSIRLLVSGENSLTAVLESGDMQIWSSDEENGLKTVTGHNILLGPIVDYTECGDHIFVSSEDTDSGSSSEIVTQYEDGAGDAKYEPYEYDETAYSGYDSVRFVDAGSYEDSFVEIRRKQKDSGDGAPEAVTEILVRDISTGEILLRHDTVTSYPREGAADDENPYTSFLYSGIDSKRGKVYFLDNNGFKELTLLSVDLKTGEEEKIPLNISRADGMPDLDIAPSIYEVLKPSDMYSAYADTAGIFSVSDGKITYAAFGGQYNNDENDPAYVLRIFSITVDPETGEGVSQGISEPYDELDYELYGNVRINSVCGRMIVYEDSHFTCYDLKGSTKWTGEELSYEPAGFEFADDGTLLVLEQAGSGKRVHIYSQEKGVETGSVELGGASLLRYEMLKCVDISDDEKLLVVGDDAFLVGSSDQEIRSVISDSFIAYDPDNRVFMLGDTADRETGHVPYRSLEEMIAEAEEDLDQ